VLHAAKRTQHDETLRDCRQSLRANALPRRSALIPSDFKCADFVGLGAV
jgi:hypothetical protein